MKSSDRSSLLRTFIILSFQIFIESLSIPSGTAQVIPDSSLGNEKSRVNAIDGVSDRIDGGARRGGNLFHSFQEFNVNAGKKVYFANPEGVMNILSRVTGGNASQIMGKLGVLGQSNLFLINPNGIIFGPGSSLDVRGSFVGTTARGVIFADGTEFSATNPQSNPLLTISVPLGLQMGNQPAPIKVESTILTVKLGQTLALVGGDLTLDGARLNAPGGGIVFGSLSGNGLTGLNFVDNIPTFSFPAGVARGDVLINNGSKVDVQGWDGGSIAIDGGNINITGISEIRAGIFGGPTSGEAGNIDIKATGTLNLEQQSQISNTLNLWAVGKAGDINITAENLSVKDGAQIGTLTQGVGDAGNINLIVGGTISFDGMDANWFQSGALSQVQPGAQGNGGTVKLTARSISFSNFGGVSVSSSGEGNAGNVILNGGDEIVLDGGYVLAGVASGGNGKGGDINVNTPFLTLVNGAQLVSTIFEDASGTAGNINIIANSISLSGVADGYQTAIFSNVYGTGNGGNINLTTGKLSITDQAQLVTTNVGQGNAGNLNVQAKESVLIDGFNTGVYTSIGPGVQGNAGGIVIDTKVINIGNGSQINATTEGKGNGGTIAITATEAINLTNGGEIISKVVREATGNAGDITLSTNSLSLTYYAKIEASTAGVGDAGLIKITADNITLDTYSNLKTIVEHYTTGNSRGIEINTNSLTVTGGANLLTSSYDKGDAGDIKIIARDKITLSGLGQPSDAYKTIDSTILADAEGNSGAIDITAGSLQLTDGAQISASTSGAGDTGKVKITATGGITLSNSKVESVVNTGAAGNSEGIEITTGSLSLTGGSIINATTEGRGNAGDISINAAGAISVSSEDNDGFISGIISQVAPGAKGNSEGIEIVTGSLSLEGGARISASTFGKGDAGAISITAADRISVSGEYRGGSRSGIYSQVETTAQGNSGGIGINTGSLSLEDGAIIDATTSGRGNAGAISITAARSISLLGEDSTGLGSSIAGQVASGAEGNSIGISITSNSLFLADKAQISTTTFGGGTAGNISITANTLSSSDGSRIKTDTETAFDAGNLTLNISDTLTLSDSRLIAETTGAGKAGNIIINAPRFDIADGALVSAKTSAPGNGGSITINAPQSLSLGENSQLTVETGDAGRAGNIDITSDTVTIGKNAEISATATATATNTEGGGSITLNAANLALSGKLGIFAETAGSAPAGSLTINANGGQPDLNIQFTDTAVISARTSNRGTGGSINISSPRSIDIAGQGEITVETTGSGGAGNINITTGQLSIGNGTRISASTAGTGSAGSINLDAREGITIADPGSGLYARTSSGGDAGNIVVTTPQFNLDSSAIIQASTSGSGKGGNITINAPLSLILGDRSQLDVESSNAGKAGNIDITSNTVTIGKDARISATATPTATAGGGNIALNASNLNIAGQLGIFAETGGEAPAGTLILNPDNGNPGLNIRFIEQGKISASTSASGKGGDINISAPDVIDVRGNGSIATATSGSGDAGTIGFSTDELILANGVTVTASTTGSGKAGNIHLNATGVNLQKATVTAFTDGVGNAGSITVPNANSITLDDSTISTEIKENGRANQASNITLTSGTLNLRNNSEINASTSGEGNAGEITLTNQQLQLENSKITAFSSGVGDAGSISLPETENLTLMNGSEISVSTGEKGNAGSITVPLGQNISLDNSKITASTSGQGNTGIINLRGTRKIQLVNNSEISNPWTRKEWATLENQSRHRRIKLGKLRDHF
ncbi:MAG: hypothetical protein N5P05_003199 [Chroococcopsis gigantea SAG 12.99]|nr:hypothetical protein [Chroococcopsis gigantea SAG 12.99]